MKINSSYHQQRMWFIDNFEKGYLYEGGPIYHNVPLAIKVNGSVSKNSLIDAFKRLLQNHEILRTKLILEDDINIFQNIIPIDEVAIDQLLIEEKNVFSKAEDLRTLPFDYANDFLLKGYYEINQDHTCLLLIFNHAIVDGYSLKKIREFFINALEKNEFPQLDNIIQYQNFSNWQNALGQDNLEPLLFYWKAQLKDLQVLYFPTDNKREHIHVFESNNLQIEFPKNEILEFCDKHGGNPKLFLLTAYKMLLSKYTSLSDIVVGTVMSLRQASKNVLLGPVDNLVVLRSNIDPSNNVLSNYKEVTQTWELAEKYKAIPFDKLVAEINPKKDRSRTALFDILFTYDVKTDEGDIDTTEINDNNKGWGKYDLNLQVTEGASTFTFSLTYNDLYFEKYTAVSFLNAYKKLIIESGQNPDLSLKDFNLLTKEESTELLNAQQNALSKIDKERTIISEFLAQVNANIECIALVGSAFKPLNYNELNSRSNQFANSLKSKFDIVEGDKVAVVLPKSEKLIISLFSTLKLGATYVPVDPEYPQDRIDFILSDSDCKLTIDAEFLEQWLPQAENESEEFKENTVTADSIAYIIYTSGTTGKPKGVKVSHGNVVALLDSCYENIEVNADDTWTLFHSYCFDFSVWEIFGCLLSGGKLLMITPQEARDVGVLCQLMNKHNATIFSQTPSSFYNFINYENLETKLRYVIFGGEMLLPNKLKEWNLKNPEVALINMYGITETTVHVTYKEIKQDDINSEISNIGVPLSFARIYILNEEQQLLPYGRIGEMFIGGHGVAKGYLNRPELDSERFLPDMVVRDEKMYKTGDKARWLPNGEIEFIGRVDRQVKIRGYRIELDEIENTISQYSNNIHQVAVDTQVINSEEMIVAYYVSDDAIDKSEIRNFLQNKLPEYMVPSFFVELESMQLTSNGKVDRDALPNIEREDLLQRTYVAPATETEQKLAEIWQEILGIKQASATDDFFELGGHSLKIIMMKSRVQAETKIDLKISDFFDHPILKDLAKFIDSQLGTDVIELPSLELLPESEVYESSKAQKRLWFVHQLKKNRSAYNIDFTIKLSGSFQLDAFQKALDCLIERHEILRTTFQESSQVINPFEKTKIDVLNLSEGETVRDTLVKTTMKPFDLEKGPLIKVSLLQESANVHYILFCIHHIIFDDWSSNILMSELLSLYATFINNDEVSLKPIKYQYKEYAHWKNKIQDSEYYRISEKYWIDQFSEPIQPLELHYDNVRPRNKTFNGNNLFMKVDDDLFSRIQNQISKEGISSVSFFMTCFRVLLYKYSNQSDVVVGLPVSDRDHIDLENQIGLYLNVLPIRTNLNSDFTLLESLHLVHNNLMEALNHKEYSFDELLEKVNFKRDASRSPLFDVMFAHQYETQSEANVSDLDDLTIESIGLNPPTSKFDLLLSLVESKDSFELRMSYNTDLFGENKIQQIFDHLMVILDLCCQPSTTPISKFSILSSVEKEALYPKREPKPYGHINQLINDQLLKTPNNIAIQYGNTQYSFEKIHQISQNIASNLQQKYNIVPGDRIAVFSERSITYPIALLAIYKLGASYLPIDLNLPVKRREFILNEAKPKVTIVDENTANDLSAFETVVYSDLELTPEKEMSPTAMNLDDESFIVYTSGTTGNPKGVVHNYHNLSNIVQWQKEQIGTDQAQSYLQFVSFSFDVSLIDISFCLATGLTIQLPTAEERRDFDKLYEFILKNKISYVSLPFSVLRSFITVIDSERLDLLGLAHIMTYGEQLIVSNKFSEFLKRNPDVTLNNFYGPSETNLVTAGSVRGSEIIEEYQNIGETIPNNHAYLLDDNLELVPRGVLGTLYFSGVNVFMDYVDENLDNKKHQLFTEYNDGPLYNTGDLAYWREDGMLQYHGRKDQQIKIDGNRLEVREVERVLGSYDDIDESVILCIKNDGNYFLHGFYVSKESRTEEEIKSYMADYLPAFMIPLTISKIDVLPLNKNGKVDKTTLTKSIPSKSFESDETLIDSISEKGKELKLIWEKNLGFTISSLSSNYFELGGHSLSAMILLNRVREHFRCEIDIEDIFEHRTLSKMIRFIENSETINESAIPTIEEGSAYSLSPSQLSFWMKIQNQEDKEAHNITMEFLIKGELQITALNQALKLITDRHEILRTVFVSIGGEPQQKIIDKDDANYQIDVVKNHLPENRWKETLDQKSAFNIENWPLFNISITEVAEDSKLILIEMHHLISDGWSVELFVKELLNNYNAIINNEEIESAPLKIQYKDYSLWMNSIVNSNKYLESEAYWKTNLSNVAYQNNFKRHQIQESTSSFDGANYVFDIIKTDKLVRCGAQNETSLYVVVLTALYVLKYKYSKKSDLIIAGVSAGRVHSDVEDLLGYFLNSYFLRVKIENQMSLKELLADVKQKVVKALKHQIYPFEGMMEFINEEKRLIQGKSIYEVGVTYQTSIFNKDNEIKDESFKEIEVETLASKIIKVKDPLWWYFTEFEENISVDIHYNTDIYNEASITQLTNDFKGVLDDMIQIESDTSIEKLTQSENESISEIKDKAYQKINSDF